MPSVKASIDNKSWNEIDSILIQKWPQEPLLLRNKFQLANMAPFVKATTSMALLQSTPKVRKAWYPSEIVSCDTNALLFLLEDPLQLLPSAPQATFDASRQKDNSHCLLGTRVDVLQEIRNWADGKNDETYIFWLSGWAGTGKSTVARTVAYEYHRKGCLGANFFFSRDEADVSHAGKFFTSIAVQLAANFPALGNLIRKAVSSNRDVASKLPKVQWKLLIHEPLSKLGAGVLQQPLVLVIDALDECDNDNDIKGILELLFEAKALETIQLRIFVTSRPETPIQLKFRNLPGIHHQDLILHNIPRETVDKDILTFFEDEFRVIRDESDDLPLDWPGKEHIDKLVSSAHGLFIYAVTVCRFIAKGIQDFPADSLLRLILPDESMTNISPQRSGNITTQESPTKELDEMYTQVLEHSLKSAQKDKEQLTAIFRQVVGAIVVLFDPLSLIAIARLLDMDNETIKKRFYRLRSILEVPARQERPIRLLHPSFRDFLLDKQRCRGHFWVDEKKAHEALAESCPRLMSKNLRRDICDLRVPHAIASKVNSSWIEKCLPADVQYACRYWLQHLQRAQIDPYNHRQVHEFFQKDFLHWLEALSLIGKISEGGHMVTELSKHQSTLQVSDTVKSHHYLRH
jgi:hypothetical protein